MVVYMGQKGWLQGDRSPNYFLEGVEKTNPILLALKHPPLHVLKDLIKSTISRIKTTINVIASPVTILVTKPGFRAAIGTIPRLGPGFRCPSSIFRNKKIKIKK